MASVIATGAKAGAQAVKAGAQAAGKATLAVVKSPAFNLAMDTLDVGMEAGFGGAAVSDAVSGGKSQRKIATEAVSLTANIAVAVGAAAVGGPIGLAVAAVQILGMALDMLWNPYKVQYNDDLEDFKKSYEQMLRAMYLDEGYNWPLEMKPNVLPLTVEENDLLQKYIEEYYTNRGIIAPETVLEAKDLVQTIAGFSRITKRLFENEDGTINREAVYNAVPVFEDNDLEEIELLVTLMRKVREKKRRQNLNKFASTIKIPERNSFIEFSKKNWQLYISILICIIIIIFSCSILITST